MAKPTKYLDPLTDFAFKKIFGSDPNKDLLIAFLNEIFQGRKNIVDLVYNKNEHPGDLANEGGAIFDLLCTGDQGEKFIIEVQRSRQENFRQRALFYTSRLISEQAPKGRRNKWAYVLPEVYLVGLLEDFELEGNISDIYLHDICLCNRETGKIFYDRLGYFFIELRKFVKTDIELESDLEKWIFVLKNMSTMDKIPVYLRKPVFEKLFGVAEYCKLTMEEKQMYDNSLKYKWDNENVLDYAVKEAKAEALKEAQKNIALEMKKAGLHVADIAKFTKLSIEDIEQL